MGRDATAHNLPGALFADDRKSTMRTRLLLPLLLLPLRRSSEPRNGLPLADERRECAASDERGSELLRLSLILKRTLNIVRFSVGGWVMVDERGVV